MRVLVITDLEGVNGVLNFRDWCVPEGRRNEAGCRFLTEEVNAAVEGFFRGGASEVIIADGHGSGGSIRGEMLDLRAALIRGGQDYPIIYDSVDALAILGQHAMAGSANAHLAHTQTEEAVYFKLNDVEVGEFGQLAYAYDEINVPTILAVGDKALAQEAQEFIPNIITVAVKEGFNAPQGTECPAANLLDRESSALHYPRKQILENIEAAAMLAAQKYLADPANFAIRPLTAPYRASAQYRATSPDKVSNGFLPLPARLTVTREHSSITAAIKEFYTQLEWSPPDGKQITEL